MVVCVALSMDSQAQPMQDCGSRSRLPTVMWEQHGEVLAWQGVARDGSLVELYLALPDPSGAPATWTIIQSIGDRSCARADGVDWLIPTAEIPEGPET